MPLPDAPPAPPPVTVSIVDIAVTTERVGVTAGATMGLTGLHHLRPLTPRLSLGASVFGATSGDRGGFFAWGVTGLYRWREGPWSAEAGLFAGGGGGSPVWVGGGLMLRPHLAVQRDLGPVRLGVGVSQVNFPNGQVNSTQPFVTLAWSGDRLYGPPGGGPGPAGGDWPAQAWPTEMAATFTQYTMRNGSARRDGTGDGPPLRTGGLMLRRDLPGDWYGNWQGVRPYWLLSAAGSLTGDYAGYAEFLAGLGARWALPSYRPLSLRIEGALGSGGGGTALDTAGGALAKLNVGVSWRPGGPWQLSALAGRIASGGRFDANEARLELAWLGWDVVPGPARSPEPPDAPLNWQPWTASAGWAHYPQMRRDDGSEAGLDLALLKLEREIGPHWRLVGQAGIATHGNAGGYATGQLGVGWLTRRNAVSGWRVGGEFTLGAAGGGGVRVNDGLIAQAQAQARYEFTPAWGLQLDAGWLRNHDGSLSTPFVGLSAVVSYSRLQAP